MYLPPHFEERRPEVLQQAMDRHPLGLLITQGSGGLCADPVPFLFDAGSGAHGTLRAHVARANPVWHEARLADALVVFQGPQGYVSPSWYAAKAEHGKVVPTWNYVIVQARGRLRVIEEAAWLHTLVSRLTERHESGLAAPWHVGDAPADYIEGMLRAIVGIEIEVSALTGKWKVSQNRSAADREGVARALEAADGALAGQVREPGSALG